MKNLVYHANRSQGVLRTRTLRHALQRRHGLSLGLLLLIWLVPLLLPEGSGLRFGVGYRVFFTIVLLLGGVFFWFLGKERLPAPRSEAEVLGSVAAVFALTVGLLVAAGMVYPQFSLPRPPGAAAQEAVERGKELFWSSNVGCFRCHTISGSGGTRGPELTHVGVRAGERVPGLAAEQYLLEKVGAGATYQFVVPEYAPIMPAFGKMLTPEQLQDLVAFLLSLK